MIAGKLYRYPQVPRSRSEKFVGNAAILRLANKIGRVIAGELARGELSNRHQPPSKYHDWTAVGILFRVPPTEAHPEPCAVQLLFDIGAADGELVALDRQLDVFFPLPHHTAPPPMAADFPFHETYSVIWRRGKRVLQ